MLPIRIKAVSESDLRMLGTLARNIQRVLPVTQADIDAAAALGKGWVVWKVIEVTDPIDNLRGGTQLVIKESSITPGKNIRRVLIVSGPGGQMVVVGPDGSPLALPDAVADSLQYVKAYGGTYQGVPEGYEVLDYVYIMANSYLTTDIVPTYDCRVEFDFQTTTLAASNATTYLGVRPSSSGNGGLRVAHISSKLFRIYGFGSYKDSATQCQSSTRYKYVWDNQHATITTGGTTVFDETYTDTGDNTYPVTINGWNSAGTVTAGVEDIFVYSLKIWDAQGKLVANYVPCKKLDPLTVGFYDVVSQTFKTATAGTFAAGTTASGVSPTPDAPMPIFCNNGELIARHASGLPLGYTLLDYIESNGTQYIDLGYKGNGNTKVEVKFKYHTATSAQGSGRVFGSRNAASVDAFAIGSASGTASTSSTIAFFFGNQSYLVTGKPIVLDEWLDVIFDKTTHSINGVDYGDPYNDETFETPQNLKLFGFDNNGTMGFGYVDIACCKLWDNGVLVRDLVPAKNSSNTVGMYDLVSGTFFENDGTGDFAAGTTLNDPVGAYAVGPIETIADSTSHTATCEDLFAIGANADIQQILSGVITRKFGVKVLDGSEGWQVATGTRFVQFYSASTAGVVANSVSLMSTIAPYGCTAATRTQYDFGCYSGGTGNLCFQMYGSATLTTVSAWQTYLQNQYAAGTPVIVLYPLATEATESVPGQTLQVADGANTLTITQAGMDGLQLEAEYEKAV